VAERPLRGRTLALGLRPGIAADAFAGALRGLGAQLIPLEHASRTMAAAYDLAIVEGPAPDTCDPVLVVATGLGAALGDDEPLSVALRVRADRLGEAALRLIGAPPALVRSAAAATAPEQAADGPRPGDRVIGRAAGGRPADGPLPQVLLVEDNDVNRTLALRQLERLGVSCHAVSSGAEAVDALRRGSYAVVLMDCRMPEMDGFEATCRIRQRDAELGVHTPIIALTADGRPEDRTACLAAGMDDHVPKPLTIDDLDRALAGWLPADGAAPTPPAPAPTAHTEPEPGLRTLLERIGQEETVRLFATWKTETPRRLEAMRVGLDRRDAGAVADAAHVLKSTCGLFGAR